MTRIDLIVVALAYNPKGLRAFAKPMPCFSSAFCCPHFTRHLPGAIKTRWRILSSLSVGMIFMDGIVKTLSDVMKMLCGGQIVIFFDVKMLCRAS